MRTVIAIQQMGRWIQVFNLDFETAVKDARNDPNHREIAFLDTAHPRDLTIDVWKPK